MVDLSTVYSGLMLKNPIIAASSGLTGSVQQNLEMERNGAGAVVLKSIFEEEIVLEHENMMTALEAEGRNLSNYEYYDYEIKANMVEQYTTLIKETKKVLSIPVIASVNCVYSHEWTQFAKDMEKAGADALELNMFILPSDVKRTGQEIEQHYFDVIDKVKKEVSIPVAVKMSYYFSALGNTIQKLSESGVAALVLFNRFYSPDIDIETFEVLPTNVLSTPNELAISLRWIAIMANRVKCDLAATTGVHDGEGVIKQVLAGAKAVQVASALYNHGPEYIRTMVEKLQSWMEAKKFETIEDFRGRLSQDKSEDPALYERVQFMKYFGEKK